MPKARTHRTIIPKALCAQQRFACLNPLANHCTEDSIFSCGALPTVVINSSYYDADVKEKEYLATDISMFTWLISLFTKNGRFLGPTKSQSTMKNAAALASVLDESDMMNGANGEASLGQDAAASPGENGYGKSGNELHTIICTVPFYAEAVQDPRMTLLRTESKGCRCLIVCLRAPR